MLFSSIERMDYAPLVSCGSIYLLLYLVLLVSSSSFFVIDVRYPAYRRRAPPSDHLPPRPTFPLFLPPSKQLHQVTHTLDAVSQS